ncbi:MAG TPA: alpha-galactosidase [Candidatus Anaerofilum excrementigallinarum]|nr:alpha-galactosidase [Candidatus Anaerofilum excrementigallinarum]
MSIRFDASSGLFTLETARTTYAMQVDDRSHLLHLYYGRRIGQGDLSALYPAADHGFSPDYYASRHTRGLSSPDVMPQEYTGCNTGDFRLCCLAVRDEAGALGAEFIYDSHRVEKGKYALEGLPAAHDEEDEAETLVILLKDPVSGLELELLYSVFARQDIITRAARLRNAGTGSLRLEKVASVCLDLPFGQWDVIHFHGRHAMERQMQRNPLANSIQTISSTRGSSSHHHNPFVILCDHQANEDTGLCYGVMPVYSGSFRTDIELDQTGLARLVTGIHDQNFNWLLEPGAVFTAPEVLLCCSGQGLGELSRCYHRFIRHNICRGEHRFARRPVLINNWEATYFQFNTDSICRIARQAAELGVEMLVLDDGWFGKRDDDNSGLGDWFVNEKKLPGGLSPLIEQVNALGMKFGIWVEPEMVSEDSDLYRAHPDWAFTLPGRDPAMGRNQLVLDLGRDEVVDYLVERLSTLLRENHIEYVKWDMNRNMSDVYSRVLPPERQGEATHRYMLGVYRLLETLTSAFPHVLFEGCAGGGGRFDAGMLAYFPQIWCSDDSDAIERLVIQHGTSFGYPVSTMGAHVSACPNHQTGRTTPLWTRAVVAMSGTFGYELDLGKLTDEEKEQVRAQIQVFKQHYDLIQDGRYYRLTNPTTDHRFTAWQFVSDTESLVNLVLTHPEANARPLHIQLRGLEEDALYRVDSLCVYGSASTPEIAGVKGHTKGEGAVYSGSTLLYAGLTLPHLVGDYPSVQLHLTRLEG